MEIFFGTVVFVVGVILGMAMAYVSGRNKYPQVTKAVGQAVVKFEQKLIDSAVKAING